MVFVLFLDGLGIWLGCLACIFGLRDRFLPLHGLALQLSVQRLAFGVLVGVQVYTDTVLGLCLVEWLFDELAFQPPESPFRLPIGSI